MHIYEVTLSTLSIIQTCEISQHKNNFCVLRRLIKHSFVLLIILNNILKIKTIDNLTAIFSLVISTKINLKYMDPLVKLKFSFSYVKN